MTEIDIPKIATKDEMFRRWLSEGKGLTYDDIQLRPGFSEVLPADVNLSSYFSRRVPVHIPLITAAMDSVTEAPLAIEMAKLGGLGVIHRNLSAAEQAEQVARVKLHLNGRIEKPITVRNNQTVTEVMAYRAEKGFSFTTFPVLDSGGKLVGMFTHNDFKFADPDDLVSAVMSSSPLTGDAETSIDDAYHLMRQGKKGSLPILAEDGTLSALYIWSDVDRIKQGEGYNADDNHQLRVGAAIGVGATAMERLDALAQKGVDVVVIDSAHADSENVIATLKQIKSDRAYAHIDVVVGNISEPEAAYRLCKAGADGIKVGIGPGSICTTRIISGVGAPQLTAVWGCAYVASQLEIPVCADGGAKYPGDIPKALAAGAHTVMMGSMFAGTDETPGEIVYIDGRPYKDYRGMGSLGAMRESAGSRSRYNQSDTGPIVPEGIEGAVPHRGPLAHVLAQYVGGLRNGMGYTGSKNIEQLRQKAQIIEITVAGIREGHVHDVRIVKEAPNYAGNGGK
jgi:IMP dehydrogenase